MSSSDFEDKVPEGHATRASRLDRLTAQNDIAFGLLPFGRPDEATGHQAELQQEQPSELLVQFRPAVSAESQAGALASVGAGQSRLLRSDENGDLLVISLPAGDQALNAVMTALGNNPDVAFAEPNFLVSVQGSNDPRYTGGNLWGMYGDQTSPQNAFGSQAGEAWAAGHTGSMKTIIGVVDTGVDYRHPDLYLNIWLNPGEIPTNLNLVDFDEDGLITFRDLNQDVNAHAVSDLNGNGYIDAGDLLDDPRWANEIDDDGNGRMDDLIGWDFVNNDNDPMDGNGHGTHVAGTIGAMGNNGIGVVGVNWNIQIMALKFLPDSGSGTISAAISAINYYTAAAAIHDAGPGNYVATNNSWGGGGYSRSLLDAIIRGADQDVLFVAAAGNGGRDGRGDNNDRTASYPPNYSTLSAAGWEAVVAVASITSSGALSSFSNFGPRTVDLGAPGSSIVSTTPDGGYASYSGTSMAAPHVAGAFGLLAAANEGLTGAELRDFMLSATTATRSLDNRTVADGRLNISDMLAAGGNPSAPTDDNGDDPVAAPPMVIYGTTRSDTLVGDSGNDVISGVPATGTHLGRRTIDTLTGGAGNDIFILGDTRGRFYDDGNSRNAGKSDYALIKDFTQGDKIQLSSGSYVFRNESINGVSGLGIYHDSNGNGRFDNRDELIGIVQGPYLPTTEDFVFA
jgi:subtilisin family serine protease